MDAGPIIAFRRGANRWAVLIGRWTLTFPNLSSWRSMLYGLLNNMNERWAASIAPGQLHCPVRFYLPGGFLNIMPRCRPLSDGEWSAFVGHGLASVAGI